MVKLLTTTQLSARPGYPTEWTMSRWRHIGMGPPYQRIMGRVFYDIDAVEEWERSERGGGKAPPERKKRRRKRKVMPKGLSGLLTTKQLSSIPGFPCHQTLIRLRKDGSGPPFAMIEGRVFYDMAGAARWLESKRKSLTDPDHET